MKEALLVVLCSVLVMSAVLGQADDTQRFSFTKREVVIPMPDGIKLATDLYLPNVKGRVPAIIVRTPYGKGGARSGAEEFAENGIAVVVQDCRGKYGSEGKFYPFANERPDGLATLAWIKEQPWSNGKVGGWGSSYVGYTQWAISDSLDVFTPDLTTGEIYDLMYPSGMLSLQTAFNWGFAMVNKKIDVIPPEKLKAGMHTLPLSVADDSTVRDIAYVNDWLTHEDNDRYWQRMNFRGPKDAPVISTAGWYDQFLKPQIADFQTLGTNVQSDNKMIIGPWAHEPQGEDSKYGGRTRTGNRSDAIRDFLISHLKGEGGTTLSPPFRDKRYNLFIMERNEYFGSDVWPPRETGTVSYYIGADHYLSPDPYKKAGALQYQYDPLHPYPNLGGTGKLGAVEQHANVGREDQLVFTTERLKTPLILLGPASASLWLGSSAACTDFIICLQDVFPDGKIFNIQQGGGHVTFDGEDPAKKEISVWPTGYQLGIGHRLRVVITSSWFPRYNRSLNTCDPLFSATESVKAVQKIYYGPDSPSSINLPVLEMKD